jgi:AcrR family transcriptional regulator
MAGHETIVVMEPLTISELEDATGTPRSTIYFYVREGLLPAAQKAAASRALYSDVHVQALNEIKRLKDQGLGLDEIKTHVAPLVERYRAMEPDLVERRSRQIREAILQTAALRFARDGYRRTRIGDIIKDVGTTPPVFYSHFATKHQLFLESFSVFVDWMDELIERPLTGEADPAVRLIVRMHAFWGLQRLSPDVLRLARAEGLREDPEVAAAVHRVYHMITAGPTADFAELRAGRDSPPVSDELMAYQTFGAMVEASLRASWDDKYSKRDVMLAHLFLYLALEAAYTGQNDVASRLNEYTQLIDELLAAGPPIPRALEHLAPRQRPHRRARAAARR